MTNQMILSCKSYLTEDGAINVWADEKKAMISRIKVKTEDVCECIIIT